MGETDVGVAAVEAGVAVLLGTAVMRNILVAVVVLVEVAVVVMVEEMKTEISATMIGAGGLEAAVLDVEGKGVEALEEGGIGVQSEKVALKEELRLSSGIGKGNRWTLVQRAMMAELKTTGMALHRTVTSIMTLSSSSVANMIISQIRLFWFVPVLFLKID